MRSHYTIDQWDYFLEGNIPNNEKEKMKQHMAACEKCRLNYEALTQLKEHMEVTESIYENFSGKVMEMVDKKKYANKRKAYKQRQGVRVLRPVLSGFLVLVCLGAIFYFGTKYGLLQKNLSRQPEETTPIGTIEQVLDTQPTQPPVSYEMITLTLYFPNSNADCVVPLERQVRVAKGESLEKIIFEELQKGSEGDGTGSMIPEGTRLLSVETREEICYLDLSSEFVDNNPGGTAFESLLIGSIVNSLTELPEVKKVQFLINGEKREVYTHVIFDEPFERNESLIRTPENTSEAIELKVRELGKTVLESFRDRDMQRLSAAIHPDKKVRFTPYSYISINEDMTFTAEEIKNAMNDTKVYTWGAYDGIGDPINLIFKDYLSRFVYDKDFIDAPETGYNRSIAVGNTINNVFETYPEGIVIEYHFPNFDPEFIGMDWKSLRLVFEEKDGNWYLVGVVHDEWTI